MGRYGKMKGKSSRKDYSSINVNKFLKAVGLSALITGVCAAITLGGPQYSSYKNQQPPAVVESVPIIINYDNNNSLMSEESLEQILSNSFAIEVSCDYKYTDHEGKDVIKKLEWGGTGFLGEVKDGKQYFITCYHVVEAEETMQGGWFGQIYTKAGDIEVLLTVNGKKYEVDVLRENKERDIAILRSKEDLGLEKTLEFAKYDLNKGDFVYSVGFPLLFGNFLTDGIITNAGEDNDSERQRGSLDDLPADNYFYSGADISPGNSGGPLYVLENGVPRIAGMSQFYIPAGNGMYGHIHYKHLAQELEDALNQPEKPEQPELPLPIEPEQPEQPEQPEPPKPEPPQPEQPPQTQPEEPEEPEEPVPPLDPKEEEEDF